MSDEELLADPVEKIDAVGGARHASIPLPADLFGARRNSSGIDLQDWKTLADTQVALRSFAAVSSAEAGGDQVRARPRTCNDYG